MAKKILFCGLIALGGAVGAYDAQANTPSYVPKPKAGCVIPAQPGIQTATFPNPVIVPASLAVGQVIASAYTTPYTTPSFTCTTGEDPNYPAMNQITLFETKTSITHVYATNIPGVGIGITGGLPFQGGNGLGYYYPSDIYQRYLPASTHYVTTQFGVFLIKTSAATGTGTISSGIAAQFYFNSATPIARLQISPITVAPENPTCDFQSASVNVPLGEHQTSEFKGINTYTDWKSFSLVSSGCTAGTTQVHMTFTGAAAAGNGNLFAVTGGATGIGVDLQSFDNIRAVPNGSTPMNWSARAAGATYDFKARYMQTANTVTTGDANANITVNLTYN